MAYDAETGQVVLFGGNNSAGVLGDAWTWNGTDWTQQHPSISPPARFSSVMAYDSASSLCVLFSGKGDGTVLNDTWVWNGTTWTLKYPLAPDYLAGAALADDQGSGRLILFEEMRVVASVNRMSLGRGTEWCGEGVSTSESLGEIGCLACDER